MIDVGVHFSDDIGDQTVTFAVMPRIGEIVLLAFEGDVVPRPWLVTKVLHLIHDQVAPEIMIHLDPQ